MHPHLSYTTRNILPVCSYHPRGYLLRLLCLERKEREGGRKEAGRVYILVLWMYW
jgi:hypothetical protein